MNNIIFQYNNVDKPLLTIKIVVNDEIRSIGFTEFKKDRMNDNLPIFNEIIASINDFLERKKVEKDKALFLINAAENTKVTTILPKISERKLKKMYETELLSKIPNADDYDCLSVVSDANNNKIFYEYVVNTKYRKYFEKVGKALGFKDFEVDYVNSYLFEKATSNIKKDTFAYIYEEFGIANLLVIIDKELCGCASFEAKPSNYRLNIASIVDKHIYDLEKVNITSLYMNQEIECLDVLTPIVNKYIIGGKFNEK